jgi:hypothetical protein
MYDYCLGGKDNYEVDRLAVQAMCAQFPDALDTARENRLFLYRLVRFLARDAGIRQFLDLGSGLPTQNNVHQVAQQFQPGARVVYVDNDPIVLAHGRALLANDESTTVIAADIAEPAKILTNPQTRRLIELSEPVAVLFLSIGHSIVDDDAVRQMLATTREAIVPGSYLAYTQGVGVDRQTAEESNALTHRSGIQWKNRTPEDVVEFLRGLAPVERVEPGFVDVTHWRPDPTQPPLPDVDEPVRKYVGASAENKRLMEFGGVVRVP